MDFSSALSVPTCTRRIEWDAMHRIPKHETSCKAFHGHRYVAEITCAATKLDELGRVIDFGKIKDTVGGWINQHWDHTAILYREDHHPATKAVIAFNQEQGKPAYLLDDHPTAENLAKELAKVSAAMLQEYNIRVIMVRLWETPNCSATWQASDV